MPGEWAGAYRAVHVIGAWAPCDILVSFRLRFKWERKNIKRRRKEHNGAESGPVRSGSGGTHYHIGPREKSSRRTHGKDDGIASTDCFSLDDLFDDPPGETTIDGVSLFSLSFLFSARTSMPRVYVYSYCSRCIVPTKPIIDLLRSIRHVSRNRYHWGCLILTF